MWWINSTPRAHTFLCGGPVKPASIRRNCDLPVGHIGEYSTCDCDCGIRADVCRPADQQEKDRQEQLHILRWFFLSSLSIASTTHHKRTHTFYTYIEVTDTHSRLEYWFRFANTDWPIRLLQLTGNWMARTGMPQPVIATIGDIGRHVSRRRNTALFLCQFVCRYTFCWQPLGFLASHMVLLLLIVYAQQHTV